MGNKGLTERYTDSLQKNHRLSIKHVIDRQDRNLVTEPSLWPAQSYGTVYQQQFVKKTACIRLSASSKLVSLLYVLMTDYPFMNISQTLVNVMHCRSGAE